MKSVHSDQFHLTASENKHDGSGGIIIDSAIVATVVVTACLAAFQIYSTLL